LKFEVIQHAEDRFREHVLLGRQILANFPSGTPLAVAVMSVANYAIQVRLQSIDATLAAGYLAHFNACDSFEARKGVALTFKSSRIGSNGCCQQQGRVQTYLQNIEAWHMLAEKLLPRIQCVDFSNGVSSLTVPAQ
jgi:hypothetical protein